MGEPRKKDLGLMSQVELIALPGGFEVGGEKEGRVKSGQLGSTDLSFSSLPKEAEVEGFLQPNLRSGVLELSGKQMCSCLPLDHWDRRENLFIYLHEHLIYLYTLCAQHYLSALEIFAYLVVLVVVVLVIKSCLTLCDPTDCITLITTVFLLSQFSRYGHWDTERQITGTKSYIF